MDAPFPERRSDPRRGIALRVGLTLTATGIASVAIDRRAFAAARSDVVLAIGFGLFLGVLLLATFRRPAPGALWIAFASFALGELLAVTALGANVAGMVAYVGVALVAMSRTAAHLRPFMLAAFALWTPALWLLGPSDALARIPPPLQIAALVALAFTIFAIADPRRIHPSDRLRRAGYGILAIAVVSAAVDRDLVVRNAGLAPDQLLAIVSAFVLPALSYLRIRPMRRDLLAAGLALATFAFTGFAYILGKPYHADAVAAVHYAGELLLSGQDPYRVFDLPQALARFGLDPRLGTHLLDGTTIHTFNYPPLAFLLVVPFLWAGLDDIRWVYLGVVLLIGVVTIRQLRPTWRAMALATLIDNGIVARQWILAGIDPFWALFVLVAWLLRSRRWTSSILFGLALADRQPAWFVTPFFLLAIAHREGAREAFRRGLIALAVPLLVELPFLLTTPERSIAGIVAPIFAPLVSGGVGLIRYSAAGYLPRLDHNVYTVLSLGALVGLLVLLWRRPGSLAGAPLVWPFLPLYLAWRSLTNYFAAAPLFALVGDDELVEHPIATAAAAAAQAGTDESPPRTSG